MAKISFTGNIGRVETGITGDNTYISFSVAEQYSYVDKKTGEWVNKGTEWRDCIIWTKSENTKKIERLTKFIVKGAGVLIDGRTSISPSDEKDEKGNSKYLNSHVVVDSFALTTERLDNVVYKERTQQNNTNNIVAGYQDTSSNSDTANVEQDVDPFATEPQQNQYQPF